MKVYLLYTHYYDYCEVWDTLCGIYINQDSAILKQIELESSDSIRESEGNRWVTVEPMEVSE